MSKAQKDNCIELEAKMEHQDRIIRVSSSSSSSSCSSSGISISSRRSRLGGGGGLSGEIGIN